MSIIYTELKEEKLLTVLENPNRRHLVKCTKKDLEKICVDQNLKKTGLKYQLINRLLKHLHPDLTKKVWTTCIGKTYGKCYCCWKTQITFDNFHLGIIFNQRGIEVDNILPICNECNHQMKYANFDSYSKKNNLPLRRYGYNAPIGRYIKGILWWQSLIRMWLERKNPESTWRLEFYTLKVSPQPHEDCALGLVNSILDPIASVTQLI